MVFVQLPASWSQVVMRVRMCFPWVGLRKRNMEAVEGLRSYVAVLPLPAMVSVCTLEDGLYIYFIDEGVPAPLAAVRKSKMVKLMNCRVHNRKLNMKCSVLKMNCGVLGCLNYCVLQNCWKFKVNCCVLGCFCSRIQNWGFALLDIYTSGSLLLLASGMDWNQIY